ncbi:hypothetical protein pb186bvf_018805 [Paramecium bursaria]
MFSHKPKNRETLDYRIEIEIRYKKSLCNQVYKFPRYNPESNSNSLSSLDGVYIYDLRTQKTRKSTSQRLRIKTEPIQQDLTIELKKQNYSLAQKYLKFQSVEKSQHKSDSELKSDRKTNRSPIMGAYTERKTKLQNNMSSIKETKEMCRRLQNYKEASKAIIDQRQNHLNL